MHKIVYSFASALHALIGLKDKMLHVRWPRECILRMLFTHGGREVKLILEEPFLKLLTPSY